MPMRPAHQRALVRICGIKPAQQHEVLDAVMVADSEWGQMAANPMLLNMLCAIAQGKRAGIRGVPCVRRRDAERAGADGIAGFARVADPFDHRRGALDRDLDLGTRTCRSAGLGGIAGPRSLGRTGAGGCRCATPPRRRLRGFRRRGPGPTGRTGEWAGRAGPPHQALGIRGRRRRPPIAGCCRRGGSRSESGRRCRGPGRWRPARSPACRLRRRCSRSC